MRPPFNLAMVEHETVAQVVAGHRILQTHRYAERDDDHVRILLHALAPPADALVLDAGCGIGEVSLLMSTVRPDLQFILANISPYQLSLCPAGPQFRLMPADCHALPLPDSSVDCAMFSSALCQMDIGVALREAWRVLKPGGILLVNDMVHEGGHNVRIEEAVAARVLHTDGLLDEVEAAGFDLHWFGTPKNNADYFTALAGEIGLADEVHGLHPIIIRALAHKETTS